MNWITSVKKQKKQKTAFVGCQLKKKHPKPNKNEIVVKLYAVISFLRLTYVAASKLVYLFIHLIQHWPAPRICQRREEEIFNILLQSHRSPGCHRPSCCTGQLWSGPPCTPGGDHRPTCLPCSPLVRYKRADRPLTGQSAPCRCRA